MTSLDEQPNWRRRGLRAGAVVFVGLASGLAACESSVTSVGAWEPLSTQPEPSAGQGGGGAAGAAGSSASSGSGGEAESAGAGGAPSEPLPTGFYLEAEEGELSGGFSIENDATASGGRYLLPPASVLSDEAPGEALARYDFDLASDGEYIIWGRLHSAGIASNRFWFQVDGGTWYRWRITVGNIWYWDDFHDNIAYNQPLIFPLTAGPHTLLIANDAPEVQLDRLYITADGDQPPGNVTPCRPPHSIDLGGGECAFSCGAQAPAGMHSTCECGDRTDYKDAYDCGGHRCCVIP